MSTSDKTQLNKDGVDRRGFLECMAWAGTGMIWTEPEECSVQKRSVKCRTIRWTQMQHSASFR